MANPIRPNTYADGQTIDGLRFNEDFDTLYEWAATDAMHRDGSTAFSVLPTGPGGGTVPTQAAQLANKLYVDNSVTGLAKKSDAINDFETVGIANGTQAAPALRFKATPNSGWYWNGGPRLAAGGSDFVQYRVSDGAITHVQNTYLAARLFAAGMTQTSAGGLVVKRTSTAGNEIYADTSRRETKTNIREDPEVGDEYVAKLLATPLPTWDALVLTEGEDTVEADPTHAATTRGTAWDRLGPIVEDMQKVFPEGVLMDGDKPMGVDDGLVTRVLWYGFQRLVADLKAEGTLPESWPA